MNEYRHSLLVPGDTVGVISPAGSVPDHRRDAGLEALTQLGFVPRLVALERDSCPHYLAATDTNRAAQLHAAINDPSLDGLWCLRGGYGSMRTLAALGPGALSNYRKPLVGFSDITILLLALTMANGTAIHGPVVTQLPNIDETSRVHLLKILAGERPDIPLSPSGTVLKPGVAQGPILGGNLSLLVSALGTPWQPNLTGRILFLEDIGEPAYRVDRMLTQLRHSDALDGVRGVAIGQFTGVSEGDQSAMDDLFKGLSSWVDGPVVTGLVVGHEAGNLAIPLGERVCLDTDAFRLSFVDAANGNAGLLS